MSPDQLYVVGNLQHLVTQWSRGPTPDEIVLARQKDILESLPELLDRNTGKKELFKTKGMAMAVSILKVF